MRNTQTQTAAAPAPAIDAKAQAFASAFTTFEAAVRAHNLNRTEAKDSLAKVNDAERAVAWAAYDAADGDAGKLEAFAVSIATAKGVKPEGLPVYRQRARDAVHYAANMAKADRAKVNPFTLAKKLREGANKADAVAKELAPFIGDAMEAAAGALQTTQADLQARMMAGDPLAREAIDAALIAERDKAQLIANASAMVAALKGADEATRLAVGAIFATL